jgi:excisionase family DNA binding protein
MTKKEREMSAIEAARILGVGLDYLYGLIWTGKLEAHKEGNRWRVSASSVESRFRAQRGKND